MAEEYAREVLASSSSVKLIDDSGSRAWSASNRTELTTSFVRSLGVEISCSDPSQNQMVSRGSSLSILSEGTLGLMADRDRRTSTASALGVEPTEYRDNIATIPSVNTRRRVAGDLVQPSLLFAQLGRRGRHDVRE